MTQHDDTRPTQVLRFPTRRKRPYRSARLDPRRPPENVRLLRRVTWGTEPPEPLPVAGYALLALIKAVRTSPKSWDRSGGPDVLGALNRMLER